MNESVINDITEINRTWKKLERDSNKAGFREGISEGKEANFQKGFDTGYSVGMAFGTLLGRCKGTIIAHKHQGTLTVSSSLPDTSLDKISRGLCLLCRNENLMNESFELIKQKQGEIIDKCLSDFQEKHAELFHSNGVSELQVLL